MSQRFTMEDLQRKGYQVSSDKAAKKNKIGAVSSVVDGIKFSSKLELYQFNLLKATKIPFEFQVEYVLQEAFVYLGKKIQPVKIIIDFYLKDHDLIIDTKGLLLAHTSIKLKMLKFLMQTQNKSTRIELPATKEECEKLVNEILKSNKL